MSQTDSTNYPELPASKILMLVGSILLGIVVAILLAPTVFKAVPTDLARTNVLLTTLSSGEHQPKYVVFGNSVVMQGIDTRILSKYMQGEPVGYNLSSTGQNLLESALYYQELPDSVDTIVQVVYPKLLMAAEMINLQKYNAMYMFGYRPDEETRQMMYEVYVSKPENLLGRSTVDQYFISRWAARQTIDTAVRNRVRSDMTLDAARNDLFFPSSRGDAMTPAKLELDLIRASATIREKPFTIYQSPERQIQAMADFAKRTGRRFVLISSPLHPEAQKYEDPAFRADANAWFKEFARRNDILYIDTINYLPADLFIDGLHPSEQGAEILSRHIGEQLAQGGL